jgi:hypothetical protein
MLAAIIRTALLLTGQAEDIVRTEADADYSFWFVVSAACVIFGGLWLLVRFIPVDAKAPQSERTSRAPAMPNPRCAQRLRSLGHTSAPRELRRLPRRVIRLHAVTPGQSEHEYNVGDPLGTRGSALVRVA